MIVARRCTRTFNIALSTTVTARIPGLIAGNRGVSAALPTAFDEVSEKNDEGEDAQQDQGDGAGPQRGDQVGPVTRRDRPG
mgnify:CR=1 FL=1